MQAFPVHLIARVDPVRYIMSKPVLTGRLAKWTLLLNQYEIIYTPAKPARFCFWELTKQLPRVVTHPGIAPASNSLNFGVPTNPKPVSSQKASPKFRVAQRTGPTPPSKILSALGWADAPPHGFVPGSSQSNFPGWSPILGLL
ncbi:hypothetical protein L3X38_017302 [Prunus dulcis]|uniref:Reverse transcriptase RNase H-like domain-containing protein n=1 Tax=Prunus dulcis TaxID=3755 RepID=A0AAD4Z9X2_PRUDU|nr:hypothetical protein L3X38_017302 [Prunus dulcis]